MVPGLGVGRWGIFAINGEGIKPVVGLLPRNRMKPNLSDSGARESRRASP